MPSYPGDEPLDPREQDPLAPRGAHTYRRTLGRSLATGDYTTTQHERLPGGGSRRVLAPSEIDNAGGLDPTQAGQYGYSDQSGEPLSSMMDAVDEINRDSPYHVAFADRGGIRIKDYSGPLRRGQITQADVSAAKAHQLGLRDSGILNSYQKALAEGNTDHARLLAQNYVRGGGSAEQLRAQQNLVTGEQNLLEAPHPLQHHEINAITAHLQANPDPMSWHLAAQDLAGRGQAQLASFIERGAAQLEQKQRANLAADTAANRTQTNADVAREKLKQQDNQFQQTLGVRVGGQDETVRHNLEMEQASRDRGDASFKRAAQQTKASGERAARQDFAQRVNHLFSSVRSYVTNQTQRAGSDANFKRDPQAEDATMRQLFQSALGDSQDLHNIVLDSYEQLRATGADPGNAAQMALTSIYKAIGRSSVGQDYSEEEPLGGTPEPEPEESEQDAAAKYLR